MTPEELQDKLNKVAEKTAQDMLPTMEEAALTGKALLARTIQSSGFDENVGSRSYSRGYARLRLSKGLQIRFINLTFTGAMFRGWKQPGTYKEGLKVGGSVAGVDQETKNKLNWNKSRFPNFDKLKGDDKSILKDFVQERLQETLRQNLFGL